MKILVISSKFPHTASPESSHTLHLCRHLAEAGHEVHLLTTNHDRLMDVAGFTVHPLVWSWGWSNMLPIARFLKQLKPDAMLLIYLGWIYDFHPMATFLPTLAKTILPQAPFVTQFENVQGAQPQPGRRQGLWLRAMTLLAGTRRVDPVYGSLLKHSARVIVLAEQHLTQLEAIDPLVCAKSALIPAPPIMQILPEEGGAARKRGRIALKVADNEIVFLYFGFLYISKGLETLLDAFQLLQMSVPNVRLVMVGGTLDTGYDLELRQRAERLGIVDRVQWMGHCEPEKEEASLYMRAADVCVLPFNEGVRLNNSSFAVAVTHGLPVVTTAGEDLEAVFKDDENVLLCPPMNPALLAQAMRRLATDAGERQRLRAGALQLASEWFSWERVTAQTLLALTGKNTQIDSYRA